MKEAFRETFKEKVFDIVRKIPKGETMSYGEVARRAGSPRAFRAVGTILKSNYDPKIPCHRVISSNGALGQYNRGVEEKQRKLRAEGALD
jgi:O-6-methylguanine DNA methyltransferase